MDAPTVFILYVIPPSPSINSQKKFKKHFFCPTFVPLMPNFYYKTRFYHNFLRGPFSAVIQKGSKEKKFFLPI
jgi:hypothetical protein